MTKLLLAEDDPLLMELCVAFLESEGYTVRTAQNGKEALEVLTSDGIDVAVVDLMMPIMDGLEVCHAIRADSHYAALPILAYSASGKLLKQASLCANATLAKPFDIERLLTLVDQLAR